MYINYSTYGIRGHRMRHVSAFSNLTDARWDNTTLTQDEYFQKVASSKFVSSPTGVGIDCYRTYESILLGAVPIVDDVTPKLTKDIFKLAPTYVLDKDWESHRPSQREILSFEVDLARGRTVALAQYWLDKIDNIRFEAKGITNRPPS